MCEPQASRLPYRRLAAWNLGGSTVALLHAKHGWKPTSRMAAVLPLHCETAFIKQKGCAGFEAATAASAAAAAAPDAGSAEPLPLYNARGAARIKRATMPPPPLP